MMKLLVLLCWALSLGGFAAVGAQNSNTNESRDSASVAATLTIPPSDANVVNGLSPLNWVRKSDYVSTSVTGASLKATFKGTRHVSLLVDASALKLAASNCPILSWTVNGGAPQTHQLAAGETSILLANDVENPTIDLYVKGMSPFEDRFTGDVPPNSVKIAGFAVDPGGTTKAAGLPSKLWVNVGDSIMAGDEAALANGQGRPPDSGWAASDDARASYGYLLAQHYGFRESRIATGGYDWGGGLANIPPTSMLVDQITSTVSRLEKGVWNPAPDVVLINLGENGAPKSSDVTDTLTKLRSRVKKDTYIFVMIPVSGSARGEVTAAFNLYQSTSHDDHAHLIDLGQITYGTVDGQHPSAAGHQTIYEKALPVFDKILGATSAGSAR